MQRSPQSIGPCFFLPASGAKVPTPGIRRLGSNQNSEILEGKIHYRQPAASRVLLSLRRDLSAEEKTKPPRAARERRGSGKRGQPSRSETPGPELQAMHPSPGRD